ncbi:MAG: GntR family transcriptional regulator [Galactobacter sp.]|uniref:GntR family transcriptional regulator n=1 Tax=Galactobacter sp. TaxID=2676125 RepID=UPI0025BBE788|nr:GntR family transcriptional regulator [Galactobacter sp.]
MTVTTSKSQRAYDGIRERILDSTYVPGYRLVLSTLASELECSVVPVREAIRRLEAEGLVRFERNVGATVASVDNTLYLNTMQTLALLEGSATALAAPHITKAALSRAHRVNDQMVELLQDFDPAEFTRLNTEFHAALYEACPNTHLLDLVHRGWTRLRAIRVSTFSTVPERSQHSTEEHEALLNAIESGAPAQEIERLARQHRVHTLNAYLAAVGEPPSAL